MLSGETSVYRLNEKNAKCSRYIVQIVDVTERKRIDSMLRRSEDKFRKMFHNADVGMLLTRFDGSGLLDVNAKLLSILGMTRKDFLGKPSAIIWADPKKRVDMINVIKAKGHIDSFDVQLVRKDGKIIDCISSAKLLPEENLILGSIMDITRRKQAEEKLRLLTQTLEARVEERTHQLLEKNIELDLTVERLRKMTAEVASAEERERKQFALQLHDNVQQTLVAISMKLGSLDRKTPARDYERGVGDIHELLEEVLQETRSLARDLYPPVLMEGGLLPSLHWLATRMKEKHALTVKVIGRTVPDVPQSLCILLFEGVRELLFNVTKHAGVRVARVTVSQPVPKTIHIAVSDRGNGFSQARTKEPDSSRGLGLFHLRERLACVGGSIEVITRSGQGTRASITVPLNEQ